MLVAEMILAANPVLSFLSFTGPSLFSLYLLQLLRGGLETETREFAGSLGGRHYLASHRSDRPDLVQCETISA